MQRKIAVVCAFAQEDKMSGIVFICTSVDGFISRENGDIDWLDEANKLIPKGEDLGWKKFQARHQVMIMGRKTFEKVREMELSAWPYQKPIVVLTRNAKFLEAEQKKKPLPSKPSQRVSQLLPGESLTQLMTRLQTEYGKDAGVYVDGGETIRAFLEKGLIREMIVTVAPVLLGNGLPLFGGLSGGDRKLQLMENKSWPCGFIQNTFRVLDTTETLVPKPTTKETTIKTKTKKATTTKKAIKKKTS